MSIREFVSRLLGRIVSAARTRGAEEFVGEIDGDASLPLRDWPLPDAESIGPTAPPDERARRYVGHDDGIHVFAYPFDALEIAGLVESWPAVERRRAKDGKFCAFVDTSGLVRYFGCRALIDLLRREESPDTRGAARLRWVALDQFGYADEARALMQEFEAESGPVMAVTGLARILMNRLPSRSLHMLRDAERSGLTGAAMSACLARVLCACGLASEGLMAAALALKTRPDPNWRPADHFFSWGLLHGAALIARSGNATLRQDLLRAVESLVTPETPARTVLACAALMETAGDAGVTTRYANEAVRLAGEDADVRADGEAMLRRSHDVAAGKTNASSLSAAIAARELLDTAGVISAPSGADDDEVVMNADAAFDGPDLSDLPAVRTYCRQVAERHGAGLVEADVVHTAAGLAAQWIFKKRDGTGFIFTGVQLMTAPNTTRTWTVDSRERGTTGMREAIITTHLMQKGRLTVKSYKASWACDPYDAAYNRVDRSTLRYMSDDMAYDALFPGHPLSKVRRALRRLSENPDLTGPA